MIFAWIGWQLIFRPALLPKDLINAKFPIRFLPSPGDDNFPPDKNPIFLFNLLANHFAMIQRIKVK